MADRNNRYERAFAWYLRERRIPTISVDETRRGYLDDRPVKSLDFVVRPSLDRWLLVDVKGRKVTARRGAFETWATEDDVEGLGRWQTRFGPDAVGLLVFLYDLAESPAARPRLGADRFDFEGRPYACLAVPLEGYRAAMRQRSPRWRTVGLNRRSFDEIARPVSQWLFGGGLTGGPA